MQRNLQYTRAHGVAELVRYLNYCKSLKFEDTPDYTSLRNLFRNLFFSHNFQESARFDWDALVPTYCSSRHHLNPSLTMPLKKTIFPTNVRLLKSLIRSLTSTRSILKGLADARNCFTR